MTKINTEYLNKYYEDYVVYKRDHSVYQRFVIKCEDENYDPITQEYNEMITHEYHACINVKNGDLFFDCRRRKILAKHLALVFVRPAHSILTTLWHATIVGRVFSKIYFIEKDKKFLKDLFLDQLSKQESDNVLKEIYNKEGWNKEGWNKEDLENLGDNKRKEFFTENKESLIEFYEEKMRTYKDLKVEVLHSLADVVRTPFYGAVLTVVHVAAVIFGCLSPNTLYRSRDIAGKLERRLLRVERVRVCDKPLTICFSPRRNLKKEFNSYDQLKKFVHMQVWTRRRNKSFFNDWGKKLPENAAYISAAADGKPVPIKWESALNQHGTDQNID